MKKTRAMKVLAVVLASLLVLGTSISAMAANVTSTTRYKADGSYSVTTNVSGLSGTEMATYLVTNAESLYQVDSTNIQYVDQKTTANGAVQFSFTGASGNPGTIYVGAESLAAPQISGNEVMDYGAAVYENGILKKLNTGLENTAGTLKEIKLANDPNLVVSVYKNDQEIDFFKSTNSIYITEALADGDSLYVSYVMPEMLSAANLIDDLYGNGNYDILANKAGINATGSISSLNARHAILLNGADQGEPAEADFWYLPQKWNNKVVTFSYNKSKYETYKATPGKTVPADIAAAMENVTEATGNVDVTFTNYQPYGITLNGNTTKVEYEFTVPVAGKYEVCARSNSYTVDRRPTVEIHDSTGKIAQVSVTPAEAEKMCFSTATEQVTLEPGTYTAKIYSSTAIVRLDFLAFLPAGPEASAVVNAADRDTFVAYTEKSAATSSALEVRLGTVKATQNALTVFGRVLGDNLGCTVKIGDDAPYDILALGSDGAFALELVDDTEGADLATEFRGKGVVIRATALDDSLVSTHAYYIE